MADGKQAAKWMEQGKQVLLKSWHPDVPNIAVEDDALVHRRSGRAHKERLPAYVPR